MRFFLRDLLILFFFGVFGGCAFGERIVTLQLPNGQAQKFFVETVSTPANRTKGLMHRKNLAENEGMFFVFDEPQKLVFWMKNTLIPLDIIFIDSDWRVINIEKMARPCKIDPCPTYDSVSPGQYVLEINGGLSDKLGIKNGTKVSLK